MQEASEVDRQEACSEGTWASREGHPGRGIQGEAAVIGLVLGRAGKGNNMGPRCSRDQK